MSSQSFAAQRKIGEKFVQKQTKSKTILFQPQAQHKLKKANENSNGYIQSFKRIIGSRLFQKQSNKHDRSKSKDQVHSPRNEKNRQKSLAKKVSQEQDPRLSSVVLMEKSITQTPENQSQNLQNEEELQKIVESSYLAIKYIVKLTTDCLLIGNQNQIELIQFKNTNDEPEDTKKWSIRLEKPIEGVTVSKLAQLKILVWTESELFIYEANAKNIGQEPRRIQKINVESQTIISVQFVKKNIFLVCCRNHVQIFEIMEINKYLTINKLDSRSFVCPSHFEVVEIPEHFDTNIKIFFANMQQHTDQRQQDRSSSSLNKNKKKDVFGLYYVQIEYDYSHTKVSELKKVYQIKKSLRYELKIWNISSTIFFINLKTQVLAVKNGLIIDSVGVNFKFDKCYLKIIQKQVLVHILTDKIEFYNLSLNYDVMPQKIIVTPFDSIYFPRNLEDGFLDIVRVNEGYGIFFQSQIKTLPIDELKKGKIKYWYCLTYPVALSVKLDQIFPTTDRISLTSFQTLDMMCDMANKMGLTQSEAYRELWKKSKKQDQRDFEILLASKDYQIISQQITNLLKKRAQKFRLIIKNEQICLGILHSRIFESTCSSQNIQQYSYCHFFNIKLKTYKDIEVQRKRFEMEIYRKGMQIGQNYLEKLLSLLPAEKQLDNEPKSESQDAVAEEIISFHDQIHRKLVEKQFQNNDNEFDDADKQSQVLSEGSGGKLEEFFKPAKQKIEQNSNNIYLFATYLKTSKKFEEAEQQRKQAEQREMQKIKHQIQTKMHDTDNKELRINIKDYYTYRDFNLKQWFLQIIAQLMAKQPTFNDHLKYYTLRVLIRNFRLNFRGIYQDILCQLISTYKHKITRLIEHYLELLPYQTKIIPDNTDETLYDCIWQPLQSQQIEECLFLSDMITIQNKETVQKFQESLWFKRNNLTHHGVIQQTKQDAKNKYSQQNMHNIKDHYFYLFFSKFMEIKITLDKQLKEIQKNSQKKIPNQLGAFLSLVNKEQKIVDKKSEQIKNKILKQLLRTNELLKRVEEIYVQIPEHLKGFINLYYDLYNFLQEFNYEEKKYTNVYEFLKLRDFELFKIFFTLQKKIKGFILKFILKKYQDQKLLQNGREKFILGIQHYFDSQLSEITDLKTILNRLNGQTRQFHIQFQNLYDCLLSAMMKKIKVSRDVNIKLDELLIYIQNIPFSIANGKIFQKLLFIQEVNLEMQTLRRSRINMSILEIKNNPQIVIAALIQAELLQHHLIRDFGPSQYTTDAANKQISPLLQLSTMLIGTMMFKPKEQDLYVIDSLHELKMYFWKCVSELLCIKRHFYDYDFEHLVGQIFITELLETEKLIPLINEVLDDQDIKQMLQIQRKSDQLRFRKAIVYFAYKRRLSRNSLRYLNSQNYLRQLLQYLPQTDKQRQIIQNEIQYCHIFKKCDYEMPYPLSISRQIPILDEIQYHISKISSQKIDSLDVDLLFETMEKMRQLMEPNIKFNNNLTNWRIKAFRKNLYEFVFFKYLREKKLKLALAMIHQLIDLDQNQNCIIYCIFIIDVLLEQFTDITGDLLIKLLSYYYFQAKQLAYLLDQLISRPFTTSAFESYIQEKINRKIQDGSYVYYLENNYIFSKEFKEIFGQQYEKQEVCQLFDAIYKHLEKSSEYIQKHRYFQIIFRMMLFNPYKIAKFVYRRQGQFNFKALRAFFSFMSQQFVFNPEIILKVGTILFIILLNRIKDKYLISQQIKEYQSLDLDLQTYDDVTFQEKFNGCQMTPTQRLVYENYLAMKKKSQDFIKYQIGAKIQNELERVKKIYEQNVFLVKKNKIENEKQGRFSHLQFDQWQKLPSKAKYYLKNLNELQSYESYSYLYTDKDDTYITKGVDEFVCPKVQKWPMNIDFNKINERHQILVSGKYTRIVEDYDRSSISQSVTNNRLRKNSSFLPQKYILQKKSAANLHHNYSNLNFLGLPNSNNNTLALPNPQYQSASHKHQSNQQMQQDQPILKHTSSGYMKEENSPRQNTLKVPGPNPLFAFFNLGGNLGN